MSTTAHTGSFLPYRIVELSEQEQLAGIRKIKQELGDKVVILGHHYQRESIVELSDFHGDSFALSRSAASQRDAESIVFCGVHFMAESARILASQAQRVLLPNMNACCPMADMADKDEVELAWERIASSTGKDVVIPITYMNSSADIKAFCGARGGAVCTSSNASRVFRWALQSGGKILFFPDEHLGRNTATSMGISPSAQVIWDRKKPDGGLSGKELDQARVILWKGFCHVHTHFATEHVLEARRLYPDSYLVVHPECRAEVVREADAVGSTQFIVDYVSKAPLGSTIVIGTEINLVSRLAHKNPDKIVVPLARSLCHNMYKITPAVLLHTMENLLRESDALEENEVIVPPRVAEEAKKALEKMLELA